MTVEVLDAAYRLFRAGILRCLPYSGLAVLVLELPTLYSTFLTTSGGGNGIPIFRLVAYGTVFLLSVVLLGVITLRLDAVGQGIRPRFRRELGIALKRLPGAFLTTLLMSCYPAASLFVFTLLDTAGLPPEALLFAAVPLLWPVALFVVVLPAFWCDGLGPLAAIAQSVRVSIRRSWRLVGILLTTVLMLMAFNLLPVTVAAMLSPVFGRVDLFLVATLASIFYLVIGAFGVPFVLAVLIVAYQDLKVRDQERRGTSP